MKILWTDPAIEDLRNLHSYIAKDSEEYASSFVERIILSVDKLADFPGIGRMVPEAEQETIRELLYHGYRIIYRIKNEIIEILTVVHGRRELDSFKPAPWDID
jgi:plasmid stabilization system protein ParE